MTIIVKHSKVSTIPDTDDTSLVRPSDWNADHVLTGTIPVANGGTGADNSTDALNNLLPSQTGQNGKYLSTDGTNPQWQTVPSAGGGSSVSYYLNGGVSQGTFGGNAYYQMNKVPVTATPANFTIAANGYIAQFITDANDPALLNIPAGNWNFEMYFSASSTGGSPSFYVELYKYNGTTFTLIASGSTSPEAITGGSVKDVYLSALAVPATTLAVTDRLAVRIYVTHSGRTITLYTQDNNLCQVTTTFSTGITALNGLTAQVQTFATGTTGTDFNISSATSTHTFNLPTASATNRGALSSADWSTFNDKANAFTYTNTYIPYGQGTTTPNQSANLTFDGTNLRAGAIQNTPIGATTPSTGNFTTLTAQTGTLIGTGQNLFIYSEQFNNAAWTKTSTSIIADSITAPNGTNTADTVTASAGASTHDIDPLTGSFVGMTSGFPYVISVYAKKGTNNFFQICVLNQNTDFANFDLDNGVVGTTGGSVTAAISSADNGWYRCSLLTTVTGTTRRPCFALVTSSSAVRRESWTATGTETVYLWGANLDLGSNLGAYTQTVASTVFNTSRISFNGISTVGLEQTGALYLQPAGTGAIQAQATTSTSAGGNARGANAVDWQTSRDTATKVASGGFSTLAGGYANIVNATYAATLGGDTNTASGARAVAVAGVLNTASGTASSLVGGYGNTAAGFLNFIGGGYANSGTANAAVTTQATSAVTSGSTAVTLTGSNANIKVGQLITGTGINTFPNTYVAAISGTSLTLSQNANASGTPTLSFFTPHGVVVGGGNNQATGAYSVICGGGDAGTSSNRNVASGDWSFVGGGARNTASGGGAVVCGGGFFGSGFAANTASGQTSFVGSGVGNTASGTYAAVIAGANNVANGGRSFVSGEYGLARSITGYHVFSACQSPIATSPQGVSQSALLVLGVQTTDATATVLRSDTNAAGTNNQVILPNNSAYYFTGEVVSGVTGGGNSKGWEISGLIKRGANAAATTLVGSTVTSLYADVGASTWTIALAADTTNGGLKVTFTGQAGTTIRTVCQIRTTEMTY